MAKTNKITVKQGPGGISYIASIGSIIYNDRVIRIRNKVIPIFDQEFFTLPEDKDKYSSINVYYKIETGDFIFEQLGLYETKPSFINTDALWNVYPIAQFVVKQDLSSFIVVEVQEYSEMATYSVTNAFQQGVTGLQGDQGYPGVTGPQGYQGITGAEGLHGITGIHGITGVGSSGATGIQGVTGSDYDYTHLLDIGFESNRVGALDRSPYERDCDFFFTGLGGETGFVGVSGSVTGMSDSGFTKVEGIIETAHDVYFAGGRSEYRRDGYLPFSGIISCWINVNQRPRALYSFTTADLIASFSDESLLFPTEWLWDFGDGYTSIEKNPEHTYLAAGSYIVTLKVNNENGESYRYEEVTVTDP